MFLFIIMQFDMPEIHSTKRQWKNVKPPVNFNWTLHENNNNNIFIGQALQKYIIKMRPFCILYSV